MTETPQQAARRLAERWLAKGYEKVALHWYTEADGEPIYWRIRLKQPTTGEKWIRPMYLNGNGFELGEPKFASGKKPLYALHRIASNPDAAVWIVEGEQKADALNRLGLVATTSGSATSASAADWEPLRGRAATIWPDNDAPGTTYAADVANILRGMGCAVSCLDVEKLGLGASEDAVDWLAAHPGAAKGDVEALPMLTAPNAADIDDGIRTPRVLRLDELLTLNIQEREQILTPWLLTQSLNMIHAWRGVGKTHIALGIAYAVATGGAFLNWRASSAHCVLYIDGEMPAAAIKGRLAALVERDESDFDPAMLSIITPDVQDGPMPDLATAEGQLQIERAVGAAKLIIVDNISTLVRSGGAENDAESWRSVGEWALGQRRLGRSVVFIHHSAKGGQQRGSSKREDTLDVVIKLVRPSDYLPEQGARFEVHFEKYRNGTGDEAKSIEAHLSTDQHGTPTWTWRDVEESTFDRVVALAGDGLTGREIAEELGINKSNVSRHLTRARSLSLVSGAAK